MSSPDPDEARVGELLAQAGRRPQPSPAQTQAWETLFRNELHHMVAARRRRRWATYAPMAAVLMLVVGVAVLVRSPEQPPVMVAEVVTTVDGNKTFSNGHESAPLAVGARVYVGQTVRTAARGRLALAYRDADVRLNGNTTVVFHAASIELIDGGIYVDTGTSARAPGTPPVIITTALGSFSHVGTQFMVMIDDARAVTAAVREGTIRLRTDSVQENFRATQAGAELVTIAQSGAIETQTAAGHGELWAWVVNSSPGKAIDGLSAHEVLSWVARESGSALKYASPHLAAVATDNTIVAPQAPMNPGQALKLVNAITTLHADDSVSGELRVSGSEGDQYPD